MCSARPRTSRTCQSIGADELWVALAAWLLTLVAMLRHLAGTLLVGPAR
jgi:hypothetical protein